MKKKELLARIEYLEGRLGFLNEMCDMYRNQLMNYILQDNDKGKYGTYEELSKKYEDLWKDYTSILDILNTTNGRLAYQNMMLEKAREAYKYIIEGDNE